MLDYRSRKLVGATWAWEGSSRAIAATMRRAILQFGPPEGIYVDNGKDYIKVAKGARKGSDPWLEESPLAPNQWWQTELEAIERTGFLARLNIAVTHCIPRHPQSKHVERLFRTLHTRFDAIHSTYTSGSPSTRPDSTELAMMQHRRLFKKGLAAQSSHPLASRFILGCLSWIEEYNNTPHSGEGMDGRTPNEVFAAELNPNQKPTPEPATLALLMAEYKKVTVDSCAVRLNKRRYTPRPEDRLAWAAMHDCNEREILVAYDPGDPECAAALTLDGHFIAWLEAERLLRFAPGDAKTQQQIGDSMEIRRGLEKATRSTLSAIATAARSNGARSAEEMLYDRLQLPATTAPVISQRKPRLRPDSTASAPSSASDIANSVLEALK
jgi:putative transposase